MIRCLLDSFCRFAASVFSLHEMHRFRWYPLTNSTVAAIKPRLWRVDEYGTEFEAVQIYALQAPNSRTPVRAWVTSLRARRTRVTLFRLFMSMLIIAEQTEHFARSAAITVRKRVDRGSNDLCQANSTDSAGNQLLPIPLDGQSNGCSSGQTDRNYFPKNHRVFSFTLDCTFVGSAADPGCQLRLFYRSG